MFLGCALAGTASLVMAVRNHHQMNVMQSHLHSSVQDRLTLSPPIQSPRFHPLVGPHPRLANYHGKYIYKRDLKEDEHARFIRILDQKTHYTTPAYINVGKNGGVGIPIGGGDPYYKDKELKCYLKNDLHDVSYSDDCEVMISETYPSRRQNYDFKAFYAKLKKHHIAINNVLQQPIICKGDPLKTVYLFGAPQGTLGSEKFHAIAISDSLSTMVNELSDRPIVSYGVVGIILLIIAIIMWIDQHNH